MPAVTARLGVLEQLGCFLPTSAYQCGLAPNIHGGPAFWANGADNGFVYVASEKDYLKAFQYRPSIHDVVCGAGSTSGNCLPAKELWRDNADVPFTKFMPVTVAGERSPAPCRSTS